MAVYTHLSERTLRQYLRSYRLGDLLEAKGVSAGSINTIYDITTAKGRFILRILENRSLTDARFEETLLTRLSMRGLAVPKMLESGRRGRIISIAPRQHLSVFSYLEGREIGVFEVTPEHTMQVGAFLAAMHQAARGLGKRRRNRYDPEHLTRIATRCRAANLPAPLKADLELLISELKEHHWPRDLPRGIVHGDLFIDNARFRSGTLCGVLDFEMAATGPLLYDLAVAIGDWSFSHDRFIAERARALLRGYQHTRPLKPIEADLLYQLCRYATARFALTRFYDFEVRRRPEAQRLYKDYRHFLERLRVFQAMRAAEFADRVFASQASGLA